MTDKKQDAVQSDVQASEAFKQNSQIQFYKSLKAKADLRRGGGDAGLGACTPVDHSKVLQGPLDGPGW